MLTVNKRMPQGGGLAPVLLKRAATVELDWNVRRQDHFEITDSQGRRIGVSLPHGATVRGGDVLVAEDGSLIRVIAARQPVMVVTHCAEHGAPVDLLRAAYHLGQRHAAVELKPNHLKIEADPMLAGMLRSMHLIVREAEDAFEPEGGVHDAQGRHSQDGAPVGPVLHPDAYAGAHSHHDHGHGHPH